VSARPLFIEAAEGSSVPKPYSPPPYAVFTSDEKSEPNRRRIRSSAISTATAWLVAAEGEAGGLTVATRPPSSARR
jgi:hypothetical protein